MFAVEEGKGAKWVNQILYMGCIHIKIKMLNTIVLVTGELDVDAGLERRSGASYVNKSTQISNLGRSETFVAELVGSTYVRPEI